MSKDLGLSIVAGVASALVYLSVLTGGGGLGAVLAYVMPLPLVMIGLSWGFGRTLLGSGLGLAVIVAAAPSAAPVFAAAALLPAVILVRLAVQYRPVPQGGVVWYPPGSLLAWLAAAAVVLMVLGTSLIMGSGTGFEEQARRYVTQLLDQMGPLTPVEVRDGAVALWSALFPAMLGSAWLIMAVLNGMLAQWTVAKAGHALRSSPDYGALELPLWMLAALVGAAIIGLTAGGNVGYLARNAAVVLMWPQMFVGLAVVHQTLRRRSNAGMMLAFFYVAFFVLFGWAQVAVAGLGLVRHWTRLRRLQVVGRQEEK
ncbi:DUF2232 domain-containing protein [Telmatospirillum siberiense]|uniref:DUF2232 domain-containing protein n=1 Tax=Telmatospirillum siberiense TaxID=382514 RepID=A0A2N3PQ54_9PROT|nr:DUF2232 domain-containing protein [Telmatospirillum siberiense]PKU22535.1 hypothetical protein CWS72_21000 [Telmatospirillum siberiense]